MKRLLISRMQAAISASNVAELKECAHEIEMHQLGRKKFDAANLDLLLGLLKDERLLALEGSGALLSPLEFDSDKLTDSQRATVVKVLKECYPRFADGMARFQVTEFVGRKFADENALYLFEELLSIPDEDARALLAHGFEHLACGKNPEVADKAFSRLQSMMFDLSATVVSETLLSMERIARSGTRFASQAEQQLDRIREESSSSEIRELASRLLQHVRRQVPTR